ncbi:MAG: GatB/YqeY domain-containing protein [Stellaceae bacterium]
MLRQAFSDRLKAAMKARDSRTLGTVRLILAGLKERDIEARTLGNREPGNAGSLTDPEIARMLQGMIKQRRESIGLYEAGNRADLARQEREEIAVIESFLPRQLNEGEIEVAVRAAIAESAASSLKDMGKVMTTLRQRHAGSLDLGRAGAIVKRLLG